MVNGGVEGINLYNHLIENEHVLILDILNIDDKPASIYAIPAQEIAGYGINNGGAHEIGIIQCLDMLEMQGKDIPQTMLIGIVPGEVTFDFSLSEELKNAFEDYISVVLQYLKKHEIIATKKEEISSLQEIIDRTKDPSGAMG
ncbi:MAG: hydrogenase maturation protease [Sulfurimonas sp.]|nr:hydrogenase maturation protease [Sulfurimonas sp.]